MATHYQEYKPLVEHERQIRLLTVHAVGYTNGKGSEDVVTCTLETVPLRHANPFYALSYVWGPPTPTGPISINGRIIHVRRTLWMFLVSLRDRFCYTTQSESPPERCSIRTWADYICIQQSDIRERNFQVAMMGDIYKAADGIYAWLGDSEKPLDDGMKCIAETARLRERHIPWIQIRREVGDMEERIHKLSSSSYWTRMWIKQEAILAKDLWFFSGQNVAHWQDLVFVARLCPGAHANRKSQDTSFRAMLSLLEARDEQLPLSELCELLQRFANAKCQDPRDRIYALLALIDQETSQQILVDYQKPILRVLLENYHLWTKDHSTALIKGDFKQAIRVHQLGPFCTNIHRMLPNEDFEALYLSKPARREMTAMCMFAASDISTPEMVCPIAIIGRTAIYPMDCEHNTENEEVSYISRLSLRSYQSRKGAHARQCFIYSNVLPRLDSLVVWIGSRVLFLEVPEHITGDHVVKEEHTMRVIGTGSEARGIGLPQLSRQLLLHPRLWLDRQLEDANFTVHISGSRIKHSDLYVACNTAATLMLLEDFRRDQDVSSRDNHGSNSSSSSSSSSIASASGTGDEQLRLWSPYAFGIEYNLLQPCTDCKVTGRSAALLRKPIGGGSATRSCECRWITDSS